MHPGGTRENDDWWAGTSTKELMKGEAFAWKHASQFVDDLESYFVPIEFDQRYPDRSKLDQSSRKSKEHLENEEIKSRDDLDDDETIRVRKSWWWAKSVPFWGKNVRYKSTEYIMTYEFGHDKNLPKIVLIHGFVGSGLLYYPLFEYLNGRYHVYAIDLLGMGSSSRPQFLANSTREATLFFTESIELWRIEMGLEIMSLVCHSLGSYIGVKYAHEYPDNIDKLVLLSPLGIQKDHSGTAGTFRRADTDAQCIRKYIYMFARFLLKNKGSPVDVVRIMGKWVATWLVDDYLTRRLKFSQEDKDSLFTYLYQQGIHGRSGELAVGHIIELSLSAYEPTQEELLELKNMGKKIVIGYGETDFWNTKFNGGPVSDELIEQGYDVTIIEEATHQVFFDKPKQVVEIIDKILED